MGDSGSISSSFVSSSSGTCLGVCIRVPVVAVRGSGRAGTSFILGSADLALRLTGLRLEVIMGSIVTRVEAKGDDRDKIKDRARLRLRAGAMMEDAEERTPPATFGAS